jgi:hypothetical protein
MPEYFENSENREIFNAYLSTENISSIKETLDDFICEHLDSLVAKSLPDKNLEGRLTDCILLLKKEFFQHLERKRGAAFAEAAEANPGADLNLLKQQGIEPSSELNDVFKQRSRPTKK